MVEQFDEMIDAIAFVGDTLSPFFLEDPKTGGAQASFSAFASLDADAAAREWPFAETASSAPALREMVEGLAEGVTDDLVWEYRALFVGPGHLVAPPWGSVYTDRECVVFGEATLALRAWMREHGVARATDEKTPRITSGSCWLSCPTFVARSPRRSMTTCTTIFSRGRRIIWRNLPLPPAIPSTAALLSSRAPRFSASRISAGFP